VLVRAHASFEDCMLHITPAFYLCHIISWLNENIAALQYCKISNVRHTI